MKPSISKKVLVILLLAAALVSMFGLSRVAGSPEFHKETLAALEEKQATVLQLSAAAGAASAALSLVPGDAATPIAEKLADLSANFLVVLAAILLEKYLLTLTGFVTFAILIPAACLLYILNLFFDWRSLRALATKLVAFGLLIVLVVPASVQVANLIENTYETSIQATIDAANEASKDAEEKAEDEGFLSGILSGIANAASGVADKVAGMVNNFIEALAVMLVTSCVIPILVLLFLAWVAKALLGVSAPLARPVPAKPRPEPAAPAELP